MNTLRFSLFSLIESRLHRVESKHYQEILDNKIQSFLLEFTKLLNSQKSVLTVQKSILLKLEDLNQEDSPSGLNPPLECSPCSENQQIQQTQPELNIIIRKLQSLTEKNSRSGNLYRSVTLNTNTVNNDLAKIKSDLTYFANNFNTTVNFFSQINNQLETLNTLYEEYKLFNVAYAILASVLILVIIKLFTLTCYILSLCKEYGQIIIDFQDFRNQRHRQNNQDRQNQRHQEERAYCLVSYNPGRN